MVTTHGPVRRGKRSSSLRPCGEPIVGEESGTEASHQSNGAGTGGSRGGAGGGIAVDEQPVGRRVAYWRTRRKMSQQLFADRLGKSKSWVDKVERGVRRLDRFSVIYDIADVLQLDVQVLLGKDPQRRPDSVNCIDQVEVEEIRAALER